MGRAPCCSKVGLHRGPWTPREDTLLAKYIETHGEGNWRSLPKKAGLLRCGKSCRLRWMNYLRPDIKRGNITPDEDDLIIRLHSLLGNRWSLIAGRLPGRTDNEIKNYWNTHLSKRLRSQGTDPNTHKKLPEIITVKQNKRTRKQNHKIKNNNKKSKTDRVEPEKPKVHLPKPTRVTSFSLLPRNDSCECNTVSTTVSNSSQDLKGGASDHDQVLVEQHIGMNPNWGSGVMFSIGDYDQDHDHDGVVKSGSSDFECQSDDHDRHNLEKLYDEYLQALLKTEDQNYQVELDSFAESLLI